MVAGKEPQSPITAHWASSRALLLYSFLLPLVLLFELTHLARLQARPGQNVFFVGAFVWEKKKKKKKAFCQQDVTTQMGRHIYMIVYVPKERGKKKENRKSKMSGKQNRVFVCFVALIAAQSAGSWFSSELQNVVKEATRPPRGWVIVLQEGNSQGRTHRIGFHLTFLKIWGDFRGPS